MFFLCFSLVICGEDDHPGHFDPGPMPFYLQNTGQNQGFAGEDINFARIDRKLFTGKDIGIDVFAPQCSSNENELILNQNDHPPEYLQRKHRLPELNFTSIIDGQLDERCSVGIAPETKIECKQLQTNGKFLLNFEQSPKLELKKINTFPFSPQCPNNKFIVDKYSAEYDHILSMKITKYRNGLGSLNIFNPPLCNEVYSDYNFNSVTQQRYSFNIAATTNRGDRAYYSPKSSNLLVNVPSTDTSINYHTDQVINPILGSTGLDTCGPVAEKMIAANSIFAGSLSLLLQRNQFYSWRALQLILALSATVNDASDSSWIENAAGVKYSNIYGFGRLNIENALKISSMIPAMPPEIELCSFQYYQNPVIPSCREAPLNFTHRIGKKINFIESVFIVIETSHDNLGDLIIEVTSPSGTSAIINDIQKTERSDSAYNSYAFTARQFLGESAKGEWHIAISSIGCIPTGRICSTLIEIYGMDKPLELIKKDILGEEEVDQKIGEIIPQPTSPSHDKLYESSDSFGSLSIVDYQPGAELKAGESIQLSLKLKPELSSNPAVLFYMTDQSNAYFNIISFDKASDIDGFRTYPPHNLANVSSIHYVANVVLSNGSIVSIKTGNHNVSTLESTLRQYGRLETDKDLHLPYWLANPLDCDIVTTIVDFDHDEVIHQAIDYNTGYINVSISKEKKFKNGVISISPISRTKPNPCSSFIQAFVIGEENDENNKRIKFNESFCPEISGLEYQTSVPPVTMPITKLSPRTEPPLTIIPTKGATPANLKDGKLKSSLITLVSIFSVLLVLIVCGVIFVVIMFRIKKQKEKTQYKPETSEAPEDVL